MRKQFLLTCALVMVTAGCGSPALLAAHPGSESATRHRSAGGYCLTAPCIYVTNAYGPASVDIYGLEQHGVAKPVERIQGAKTELSSPEAVTVDANHNVYVANVDGSYKAAITVFPAGKYGDVTPSQVISGPDTQLGLPTGIAVDAAGNLYVTNWFGGTPCGGSVTVYAPGSNGDVTPIAQIKGTKTLLCGPWGTAIDSSGNLYVTSGQQYSSAVNIYSAGANGNVRPKTQISGKQTLLYDPVAVSLDALGDVYVTSEGDGTLAKFRVGAHGNAKPMQAIYGIRTRLQFPYGMAVDSTDQIYTISTSRGKVLVFANDAKGDVPPIRIIKSNSRSHLHSRTDLAIR